ncbi:MAG: aminotransferase class IV [Limisphaerales bacterium]
MLAFVNGQYLSDATPALPVNDRSFLYGDGLFETIRITNGQPFLWGEHMDRLERGAAFLKIPPPFSRAEIEFAVRHLLSQNDVPEGFVRIQLSRGPSERGYAFPKELNPILVISTHSSLHAENFGLKLITSRIRILADDPLTQHKTANRLPNILARREADDAGADEALILNNRSEIAEASAANIFLVCGRDLVTPPLSSGALAGTTREFVMKIANHHELKSIEKPITIQDVKQSDGAFLTSAHWLVTPVISLDNFQLKISQPILKSLRTACEKATYGR